jgi:GWxTD domain-containing protein
MLKLSAPLIVAFLFNLITSLASATVDVVVECHTFYAPGHGARVEVNMAMLAGTFVLAPNGQGMLQARVEVLTLIEQDGQIKTYAKSIVRGPETSDSTYTDLVHQEFFDLQPGRYDLNMEFRDLNSADTTIRRHLAPLTVGTLGSGVVISQILLAERIGSALDGEIGKFGYCVVPLLSDYYPSSLSSIDFYAEIYGTEEYFGKDSLYLLTYQLESYEKRTVQGSYKKNIRATARSVEPLIAQFDIANLASGNYVLAIEVRDRKGGLVARQEQMIRRNNTLKYTYDPQDLERLDITGTFAGAMTDRDTLAEHIRSMRAIADPLERKIIDDRWKDRELDLMRRFFYSFWANRSSDPEAAWKDYYTEVQKVNRLFGCRVLKGYETDRGIVFLKYGPPNSMMDRLHEMDSYPYTIWHYYRAARFSDKRFVFYQPSLASDCFELLHSEVPGELQNPRWNQMLHIRNVAMPNVDTQGVNTMSGDRAKEFFELPR